MPRIIITYKGMEYPCLYDNEDFNLISSHSWRLHPEGYACTTIGNKLILMHRLVMGVLDRTEVQIDHRFHNRLDNRKQNLRICTPTQNRGNSRKLTPGTSTYKGVYYETCRGLFHAQIGLGNNKVQNLGRYKNETLAAKAYDRKALAIFRDFALVNFQSSKEARQLSFPWI